jgi:hypothetical protein
VRKRSHRHRQHAPGQCGGDVVCRGYPCDAHLRREDRTKWLFNIMTIAIGIRSAPCATPGYPR